jgi:L-threonylcarbamoyladenylate synthase
MTGAARAEGALAPADAARLQECVTGGGVAVFPADTVYGVCCDPDDAGAVRRLYELKGRPAERASAVMLFELALALAALPELGAGERAALEALLPGPVTLLLANRRRRWAPACAADPGTLGLRVPLLPERLAALRAVAVPVMQSSANLSGQPGARRLADVPDSLLAGADMALDGGELPGTPSSVVDLRELGAAGAWRVLREGAMGSGEIARRLAAAG